MQASAEVPKPEPGEARDVLAALEAGARSWADGETDEALRQFARAAEAAGEAGDDRRALGLARSVAELRERLARDGAEKEVTARPPSVAPVAPAAPPSKAPPPPSSLAKARSMPPPPPSARAASGAPPPRAASVPPKQQPAPAPSAPPPPAPVESIAREASVRTAEATGLRVSVKSSVRDPDLLLVRVLRKGQAAPPGTREAVLQHFDVAANGAGKR